MKVTVDVWKKGAGTFLATDQDGNTQVHFEIHQNDLAQALKLNFMRPNRGYPMTVDIPEIKE